MAQTGYTPLLIYSSTTGAAAPSAGNLTNSTLGSELAINITDGKLFYKDNANAVQVIAWKVTPTTAGGTGLTSYTAGDLLYYATGTTLAKLAIGVNKTILTSSGTAPQWSTSLDTSQGGTGQTAYTAGDLIYYATGTAFTKLAIGANTTILTSSGSAPQWTAASSVSIGTATNLAGGAQGSIPYQSGVATTVFLAKDTNATRYLANTGTNNNPAWAQINLANGVTGTLPTGNGGTGLTSFTANGIVYASSTSALATGSGLTFDGTNFATTGTATIQTSARISYGSNTASFQNISAVTFGLGGTTGGVTSNYYQGDNAQFYPSADATRDLGTGSFRWRNLSLSGSATLPSVTISGGTINSTSVGATTASSGSFTSCAATTAFRETNGNSTVANGATFTITIPTVRRPQFLTLYSGYNLYQGWFGLIKGDASANAQVNAIVDNGGMTVAGTAASTITVTNNYGGTATIYWSLMPLGLGI